MDIVFIVNEKDEYIGIIEIQEKTIVQAKMKFNDPVLNTPQVHAVVTRWAALMDYKIGSSDLGVSDIQTSKRPPSAEKEAIVEKFYEETRNNTNP